MLTQELEKRLEELNALFREENATINLSAFRTEEAIRIGNILDSLAILETEILPEKAQGLRIIDIGTGGGFPLLPLAICLPDCEFTGIDSTAKKIHAVERIARNLRLSNVKLFTGRSEELGRDPLHREKYDIVLSRGVAEVNTLLEYCSPFTKPQGHIVLWKSMHIAKELRESLFARAKLICQLLAKEVYELPGDFGKRQLLMFQKRSTLSEKYPRAVGVPKKKPLK